MSQELTLPLGSVQLRDVFPVQLSAKRNKQAQATDEAPAAQISGATVLKPEGPEQENLAQVEMGATIGFPSEAGPFEISVTIVGVFEQVQPIPNGLSLPDYLSQVSLTLLLPFLREQVYTLSSQLRIGPVLLPIVIPQAIPAIPAVQSAPGPLDVQVRPRPTRRRRVVPPSPQE